MRNEDSQANELASRLTARELILALIDSTSAPTLSASYFIAAGALFGMDSGTLRVALGRLVKDQSLSSAGRGLYQRQRRAGALHSMVRNWAEVEDSLTPWRGGWLGGSVGHLSRGNQADVKNWERALRLCGFAPYQTGLWLRPANLRSSIELLRDRLLALGFPAAGVVLDIASLTPTSDSELATLWPTAELEQGYQTNLQRLAASEARLPALDDDSAARETLVVGRLVTRDILLDPLLPSQLINTQLRGQMIQAMKRYDRRGRRIWRDFYQRHGGASARAALPVANS